MDIGPLYFVSSVHIEKPNTTFVWGGGGGRERERERERESTKQYTPKLNKSILLFFCS